MPKLGRAFNHLDDLPLLFGTNGVEDALKHLRDFKTKEGYTSIRTKWDGRVQVYWGRCNDGKFHLAPHHVWERKEECSSKELLQTAILNSRGGKRDEIQWLVKRFGELYDTMESITPDNFRGFVYGDAISLERPTVKDGIVSFKGNVRSETIYHSTVTTSIGKKLQNSNFVIAGHGMFSEWGSKDRDQTPIDDFSFINDCNNVTILNPEYNKRPVKVDDSTINYLEGMLDRHYKVINKFTEPVHGLTDLPDLMYRYVNHKCRFKRQHEINSRDMVKWIKHNDKLTVSKIERFCRHVVTNPSALEVILTISNSVRTEKDKIIAQLERNTSEIWATYGEGYVRYANDTHTCGNIKLVPRWRWIPQ